MNNSVKGRIVDIGQCDPDHASIKRLVEGLGFSVVRAHTLEDARRLVAEPGVVLALVNRVFDLDGSSGLECISELVAMTKQVGFVNPKLKVMLVSNYPEYQTQAVALGAVQGFGKSELGDTSVREMLVGKFKIV
jgi:hypothetical protein